MMAFFANEFFDIAFWQQFTVTVMAVVFGIPTGIWISDWQERRASKREKEREGERVRQLLEAIKRASEKNRGLLKQIESEIANTVIFYSVDLTVLDAVEMTLVYFAKIKRT